MVAINIREFTHNISKYFKKVRAGERVVVMERNVPIVDLVPHNANISTPGWKRDIPKIKLKGESLSETVVKMRREEKR